VVGEKEGTTEGNKVRVGNTEGTGEGLGVEITRNNE
jgi:hypothetical protein